MGMYYLSPADYINKKPFEVQVPAFYKPYVSQEALDARPVPLERATIFKGADLRRRNPTPFYQPLDPNQLEHGAFPIALMLDMFQKKIEFHLSNFEDVVEILDGLDSYLMSIKHDVEMGSPEIIAYAKLVIAWRAEVYKHYYRYMKENPEALAKLYPNHDPNKNFLSLMASVSGTNKDMMELDPLRAKGHPPYQIADLLPKDKNYEEEMASRMEKDFGIASGNAGPNEGRDFDFDSFIKR